MCVCVCVRVHDLLSRKALPLAFISAEPPSWVKISLKETVLCCWKSKVGQTTASLKTGLLIGAFLCPVFCGQI